MSEEQVVSPLAAEHDDDVIEEHEDETGKKFFHHRKSGITGWSPEEVEQQLEDASEGHASVGGDEDDDVIEEHEDETGKKFFHHRKSGITGWSPEEVEQQLDGESEVENPLSRTAEKEFQPLSADSDKPGRESESSKYIHEKTRESMEEHFENPLPAAKSTKALIELAEFSNTVRDPTMVGSAYTGRIAKALHPSLLVKDLDTGMDGTITMEAVRKQTVDPQDFADEIIKEAELQGRDLTQEETDTIKEFEMQSKNKQREDQER
jgi:hypothetical protein